MRKLKQSEVPEIRQQILDQQNGICPICKEPILSDPVLDHDHVDGHVRAVLHRECNAIEGKLHNWFKSFGKDKEPFVMFNGILEYWKQDFRGNPLHYKHKTDNDKRIRELRRRLKKAKLKSTKDKLKAEIKQLKEEANG